MNTHQESPETQVADCLSRVLGGERGIKPLPAVAIAVMKLLSDPAFDVRELQRTIAADPALTARVLRLANSALLMTRTPCTTVSDAIVRLGSRNVQSLVASAATMEIFRQAPPEAALVRDHCAGVAALAGQLGQLARPRQAAVAYLAGLMHDIGKLLLVQAGDLDYGVFPPALRQRPNIAHLVERDRLGFDHAELGRAALEHWDLPAPVPELVGLHHAELSKAPEQLQPLVAILRIADRLDHGFAKRLDDVAGTVADEAVAELQAAALSPDLLQSSAELLRRCRDETIDVFADP